MKKNRISWLIFLILTVTGPALYAQGFTSQPGNLPPINTELSNSVLETEELGTKLTVYTLIIGVYALYWLKQKA